MGFAIGDQIKEGGFLNVEKQAWLLSLYKGIYSTNKGEEGYFFKVEGNKRFIKKIL